MLLNFLGVVTDNKLTLREPVDSVLPVSIAEENGVSINQAR